MIVVGDGLATGSTMRAAVAAIRRQGPHRLVLAVPVASPTACEALEPEVDDMVCLWAPESFSAVGQGYEDFRDDRRGGPRRTDAGCLIRARDAAAGQGVHARAAGTARP
nr:phosphoribosyltransferase family protein [Blastococcus colisei]